MGNRIHATAIVDGRAELGTNIDIGPYAIVGAGVVLGDACILHAHAVVLGPSRIGANNEFFPFSVTGSDPQHKIPQTKSSRLVMGESNVVREHATLHRGTDGGETHVGSNNLFMVGSHVAHDVTIASHVTLANGVQLAGHVAVEDYATFGGLAAVGQHARIGESAFVAGGAMVERDVPPFTIVQGDRARVRALNKVGLVRRNVPAESIAALERAFRVLYMQKLPRKEALLLVDASSQTSPSGIDPFVQKLVDSLRAQHDD